MTTVDWPANPSPGFPPPSPHPMGRRPGPGLSVSWTISNAEMTLITQSLTLAAGSPLGADMCAEAQLTTTVWNPAANPSGNGLWSESANWTGGLVPHSTNKVVLNVSGARACRVSSAVMAGQVVVGDNGPGHPCSAYSAVVLCCIGLQLRRAVYFGVCPVTSAAIWVRTRCEPLPGGWHLSVDAPVRVGQNLAMQGARANRISFAGSALRTGQGAKRSFLALAILPNQNL